MIVIEYVHPIPIGSIVLANFRLSMEISKNFSTSIKETLDAQVLILKYMPSPEPERYHWYKVLWNGKILYLTFSTLESHSLYSYKQIRYIHKALP